MTREEAIEIVKTQYSHDSVMKTALGMLIPELQESKDERMAEMAIKAVRSPQAQSCIKSWRVDPDDVIAWLEKQKEQKPISFNEPYNPDEYEVVIEGNATSLRRKEQKPTWSEEDKRILKGIIGKIDHDQTYGVSKSEMLNFLEDLRPSWKPLKQQMDALHEAVIRACSHHYGVELLSLEIDLHSLK